MIVFRSFADTIEKIQERPVFRNPPTEFGIKLPKYEPEELKKVSVGAGVLLGGIGGSAAGTAGGFAAAGATYATVMALGTASTGTAIASLSGAAATNATLAALGGGALTAGGGGMVVGTAVLGEATLGIGLLIGGIIFNATSQSLSEKADEALDEATRTETEVEKIVTYLNELMTYATDFKAALTEVEEQYHRRFAVTDYAINIAGKVNWDDFSDDEKVATENAVLLVGLLYAMCKTKLVIYNDAEDGINSVNKEAITTSVNDTNKVFTAIGIPTIDVNILNTHSSTHSSLKDIWKEKNMAEIEANWIWPIPDGYKLCPGCYRFLPKNEKVCRMCYIYDER